ncbi:MAG: hypothetical protein AAGG11_23410 [Pseudomonadota bacterium]
MEAIGTREWFLLLAVVLMTLGMGFGMATFFGRRNYILAAEWAVMCGSGSNVTIWFFTQNEWQWNLIWFLDAFSRIAGFNILLYAGFATVTHNFRPSLTFDVVLLVIIGLAAAGVMYVDWLIPARHYAFSAAHFMFVPLLLFLIYEMHRLGKQTLMVMMSLTVVLLTASAVLLDFAAPANNETNIIYNKDFVSMMSWAFGYLVISRVYVAMEDASRAKVPPSPLFNIAGARMA